jgi:hypothetical protein
VVRGDHDQGAVIEAGAAQPVEQDAEQRVGGPDLQQVALVGLALEP